MGELALKYKQHIKEVRTGEPGSPIQFTQLDPQDDRRLAS